MITLLYPMSTVVITEYRYPNLAKDDYHWRRISHRRGGCETESSFKLIEFEKIMPILENEERADHILHALPLLNRNDLIWRDQNHYLGFDSLQFDEPDRFRVFGVPHTADWHIRITPPETEGDPNTWQYYMLADDQQILPGLWLYKQRLRPVSDMDRIVAMTDYNVDPRWFDVDFGRVRRVFERYNDTKFAPEQIA